VADSQSVETSPAAPIAAADGRPALTANTRLTLIPLAIVAERGEYIVGDPATGRFFALPPEGVRLLRALLDGMTVGQAAAHAAAGQAGQIQVDGLDFANTLLEIGFVTEVDGIPVRGPGGPAARGRPLNAAAARLGRVLFSRPALAACGVLLLLVLVIFTVEPSMRPRFEDLFIDQQPAVSFAILFGLATGLAALHELCHWWAARSLGVPARIRFSRRLYFPVMETDVSGLWSVPAALRYGPLLAGMAFDVLILALAVGTRLAWSADLLDVPPAALRVCGALIAMKIFELMFQCLVFMRTDMYAVMITALGLRNLSKVSRLRMKRAFRIATPAERAWLAGAHPRDLAASRWYAACYLAGLIWAVWFFKTWFWPSSFVIITWMGRTLSHTRPSDGYWWQAAAVALIVSTNIFWPLAVLLREQRARRGRTST
jgi:putative peptide zinc metalloprotease protein